MIVDNLIVVKVLPAPKLELRVRAEIRDFLFQLPPYSQVVGRSKSLREMYRTTVAPDDLLKVSILGDCTTEPIAAAVALAGGSLGIPTEIYEPAFDTWRTELDDRASALHSFRPHVAIVVLTENTFRFSQECDDRSDDSNSLESAQAVIDFVCERLRAVGCQEILFHNLVRPVEDSLGRLRNVSGSGSTCFFRQLNTEICKRDGQTLRVVDVSSVAEDVGITNWRDERLSNLGNYPFSPRFLSHYTLLLRGTLAAIFGQSAKVLVTDLDNTLWSGTLDETGPDGIVFGVGTGEGEAHLKFANYLVALRRSGILLAINSRNEINSVEEVFRHNLALPLRLEDFASVHCHWGSKSEKMRAIASELNVSADSLVFVDDEPFQQDEVRSGIAEVSVVPIGSDPSQFIRHIDRLHLFDRLSITNEDRSRASSFRVLSHHAEAQKFDLKTFLETSGMIGNLRKPKLSELQRVEQLFMKTNQFNLTKVSFGRADLESLLSRRESVLLVARLTDKFLDYGIVAALAGQIRGDSIVVENWVVSCRVFSRSFEEFIMSSLLKIAVSLGLNVIEGGFQVGSKNQYAQSFLSRHRLLSIDESGNRGWWSFGLEHQFDHVIETDENL